jgi:hypothetical protein
LLKISPFPQPPNSQIPTPALPSLPLPASGYIKAESKEYIEEWKKVFVECLFFLTHDGDDLDDLCVMPFFSSLWLIIVPLSLVWALLCSAQFAGRLPIKQPRLRHCITPQLSSSGLL